MLKKAKAYLVMKRAEALCREAGAIGAIVLDDDIEIVSIERMVGCASIPIREQKVEIFSGKEKVFEGRIWHGARAEPPSISVFMDGPWTKSLLLRL